MTEQKTRIITLTGRPPVEIDEEEWPRIASAFSKDWDGEYEFQANCTLKWWLNVRQHADGRAIVYGGYEYSTQFRGESDVSLRAGWLVDDRADIPDAIHKTATALGTGHCDHDQVATWKRLAQECIADLPPERI